MFVLKIGLSIKLRIVYCNIKHGHILLYLKSQTEQKSYLKLNNYTPIFTKI